MYFGFDFNVDGMILPPFLENGKYVEPIVTLNGEGKPNANIYFYMDYSC